MLAIQHLASSREFLAEWVSWAAKDGSDIRADGRLRAGCPRAYHSATYTSKQDRALHKAHRGMLFLFGGFNDRQRPITDGALECLDLEAMAWKPIVPAGVGPAARFGHSCSVVHGRLVVVGGSTGSSNIKGHVDGEELKDVWLLETTLPEEELHWCEVSSSPTVPGWPGAIQRCHSSTVVGDKILCFGGGRPGHTTSDLHFCSPHAGRAAQWAHSKVDGIRPRGRQNHSCGMLGSTGLMVIYGGCLASNGYEELGDTWLLDLDHEYLQWSGAEVADNASHYEWLELLLQFLDLEFFLREPTILPFVIVMMAYLSTLIFSGEPLSVTDHTTTLGSCQN